MYQGGSKRILICGLSLALILGIVIFALYEYKSILLSGFKNIEPYLSNKEKMRYFVASFGSLAPLAFIGLQALQVIISPVPGEATGFIGGYLFGTVHGFIYSTIGLTLGSWLAFAIARLFSPMVSRRFSETKSYSKFNSLVEQQGVFIVFFLFLLPGLPKDYLCYLLGLSLMPPSVFLIITMVGRMPGTLLLTMQGSKIFDQQYSGFLILLGVSAAIAIPSYLYREKLISKMYRKLHAKKES